MAAGVPLVLFVTVGLFDDVCVRLGASEEALCCDDLELLRLQAACFSLETEEDLVGPSSESCK